MRLVFMCTPQAFPARRRGATVPDSGVRGNAKNATLRVKDYVQRRAMWCVDLCRDLV
jgi:hypothetical protein